MSPPAVFLFYASIPEDLDVSPILPRLDAGEQIRAEQFRFARDRNSFVVAHALLRHALDRQTGPGPWRFDRLPGGKPIIRGGRRPVWHVSLSHCRTMAAVAIGPEGPLGVDVEVVIAKDREMIEPMVFAPSERALLAAADDAHRQELFFTLWTLKEAAIKATGQGLSVDLTVFAFALGPPRLVTPGPDGSDAMRWRFFASRVADCRLAAAICGVAAETVDFHPVAVALADLALGA